ncbi:MAG: HlyD family efflux transporter periplasmic adaptor subunit [Halanaerobiaceae bacterium]|nr:HlyD family efflux transporter periplasmic adaptor subunit [Halanaerobiaceae bacterium]
MRTEIVNFEDLTDSREMMSAKEPNFIVIFIYLILIIFLAALIWMYFGEIDITVRATGILRPAASISVVRNINGGEIVELNYYEGKVVTEGDLLYQIDSTVLETQLSAFYKERDRVKSELENLKTLVESINKEKNLFSIENSEYYNRYMIYEYELEQLALEYRQAEKRFLREQQLSPSSTTESRLEELQAVYNISRINYQRYQSETLVRLNDEISNKENSLLQLEAQCKDLESRIELNNVKAPIDGSVQVYYELNKGDYMPAGIEVLRIIPDRSSEYRMEIMVANKDISQIETGQKIRYRFLALPYREYGVLEGEILKISKDAFATQENPNMSYRVEASINGIVLYDKKGKPTQVKPGMIAECSIVIRQKKILYYVLEKLNFLS